MIWLLLIVILGCFIAYKIIRKRLKHKIETITAFTGGLGSGKTLMSVNTAVKLYRKNTFKYYTLPLFLTKFKSKKVRNATIDKIKQEKPKLYSNIPLLIQKKVFCEQLTNKVLLLQEKIPLHSVVLLDEIGAFASQFDFKEHNVIKVFDEFVRFFRHYTQGGYLVVNDQCSENINLVIRRRINIIHNLSNCFVLFNHFCFYYDRQITISEEIKTIDEVQDINESDTQDNKVLHFKLLGFKRYDTYCYSGRYQRIVDDNQSNKFLKLKTNDLLVCPKDKEQLFKARTMFYKANCLNCGASLDISFDSFEAECPCCHTKYVR